MSKQAMGANALRKYRVNLPGKLEELSWSLYHFQAYAAAGQQTLTFFQTPVGSGGLTVVDTNMKLAGQIPAGQAFLCTAISFEFQPGVLPENSSALAGVNAINDFVTDTHKVMNSGFVQFLVGSKYYVEDSPIGAFPPAYGLAAAFGAATTAAATTINNAYGRVNGQLHSIVPVELTANQNFQVTVTWPSLVTLPSTVAGRLGCRLHGRLFRNAQ